jgi:cytochrome c oxidase assembly protein subunit 15
LPDSTLRNLAIAATVLIFLQLGIGASMRHAHAGLSIPDFPLAYGKLIPDTSESVIESINAARVADDQMPTTVAQIWLQMAHRAMAVVIFVFVGAVAARSFLNPLARSAAVWCGVWFLMICAQIALGAWTVWSNKAADVATAHMALGAFSLLFGVILSFRLYRGDQSARFIMPDKAPVREFSQVA